MENPVRTTTLKVIKTAKDVKINRERIKTLAKKWVENKIAVPVWPKKFHLHIKDEKIMLDYLILLDAINFCFWNRRERWIINYNGKKYNGYFALSLALKDFFEKNLDKGNLNYFSKISFKEFKKILQGGKNLLFLKKRWQIARAVSGTLTKKYENSENFINLAKRKLSVLIPKISREFPSFSDISYYNDKKVCFLKRAQILGCDIWGVFDRKGLGYFKDLDYLTAFADYKVPQVLHHLGILEYSPVLERKIKNRVLIPAGSREEVEIRSVTIWAIEYLKRELEKLGEKFYSFQVDWILWDKSHKLKIKTPYHLTKTIFY